MKQYRFRSQSKLSFPIQHNGRNTYVSFGSLYSGVSRFMTTDALLAEKIRKHQWFRIGLIKEDEPIVIKKEENQSTPVAEEQQAQETSIFGKPLFSGEEPEESTQPEETHTVEDEDTNQEETHTVEDEDTNQDETQGIRPEDVTSLVEAKDYLKTYYAAPREAIATRDKVIEFCKQNNIVFPNLDL